MTNDFFSEVEIDYLKYSVIAGNKASDQYFKVSSTTYMSMVLNSSLKIINIELKGPRMNLMFRIKFLKGNRK